MTGRESVPSEAAADTPPWEHPTASTRKHAAGTQQAQTRYQGMYRVKTFNQIAAKGLARLSGRGFEVGPEVAAPHAILLRSHSLSVDDLAGVGAVARAGVGVNNVLVPACTARGIIVFNTPGANANSVKELVLAALLLTSRDVLGGFDYVRSLSAVTDDTELNHLVEREKRRFKGREVAGRRLGIVGLGAIGARVARAALSLGMDVLGCDPALSVDAAWRLPSEVRRMENLASLFAPLRLRLAAYSGDRGRISA